MKVQQSRPDLSLQELHRELQSRAYRLGIPLTGGFELTPRCNLRCRMCYIRTGGRSPLKEELSSKEWIELGHMAADNGALSVFLTGGEPLIREDFREIYESFCRLGFRLTLFSNGTLLGEETARWLASIPPGTIDITLYGASENTYARLCGDGGAYAKAMNAIELLLKYHIHTRIKFTAVSSNLGDFAIVKKLAESYGLEFLSTALIHGHRSGGITECGSERLTPEQIYMLDESSIDRFDTRVDIEAIKRSYTDLPAMSCMAAKCSFFLTWKGHMVPCPLFETPYTMPLQSGYREAWDELRQKVLGIGQPDKCASCETRAFCPVCPPRLYLETGRFDMHSEYLCALAGQKAKLVGRFQSIHTGGR